MFFVSESYQQETQIFHACRYQFVHVGSTPELLNLQCDGAIAVQTDSICRFIHVIMKLCS